ncbi:hypothetical protein PPL_08545 [Heterostelium album PN500]|uniref:SMODS and SLOG-associating 2TM effector domain-containing protein n=1 Tax=Heterostelium pallidum (strain ATCC 26659 / Pp 5 / PN500) TaxID=670386 RepID=D3BJ26_HETP5|nr:hypothetical protein PPL_08545 [Heterostelium album PN500]EFA77906.1 hypothetical protein PPL_08545 [Heterostelium album PN500]|eukprot:XP_020430034.1 hypothetical protein PPL_08545 [Heterostelium album PN500]
MSIITNKNPLSSSNEKIVLEGNGLSGFDSNFPKDLKGLVQPLDFKYLMYKFNHQILIFKINFIRHIITNIITTIVSAVTIILTLKHIMAGSTNMIITVVLGGVGLFGSILAVTSENKRIMRNIEETTLELSDRYRDSGLSFNSILKPQSESTTLSKLVCTAANYNLEIHLRGGSSKIKGSELYFLLYIYVSVTNYLSKRRYLYFYYLLLHSIVGYCTSLVKEEIGRGHEFESRWSLYKIPNPHAV